ncbi:hypothetical protein SD457_00765 [Coprobacillaceae bacterium CR2/5/TPMF4]|nr:hypothetical protein SD457_00765 [Coprobacillaceae bacterium CR2/5/TPMF4]
MSLGIPVTLVSTIIRQNEENVEEMAYYAYLHQLSWAITNMVRPSLRGVDMDLSEIRLEEKIQNQKGQKLIKSFRKRII